MKEPACDDPFRQYLQRYFLFLCALLIFACVTILPYSFWWLYKSGDAALERAIAAQAEKQFALFGSGLSQDFVDYKLRLYAATRPEIIAIGSSRVMQFRGAWFVKPFLNMGGVAGNLAVLASTLEATFLIAKPRAVIMGLDFWWFLPQWDAEPKKRIPPTSGSYTYSLGALKKPWEWLMEGKISLSELGAPLFGLFGKGFRTDRFGIMAQQTNDGFGPDGSWYYTAEITGLKPALDWQFQDTLQNIRKGIRAFYHARPDQQGPAPEHVQALVSLWQKLKKQDIQVYAFIPPVAPQVLAEMPAEKYPHLYKLADVLASQGIKVLDFGNPEAIGSGDCEFVDGFHGGEVTYAKILQAMAAYWPGLADYVNMPKLAEIIGKWQDHALIPDDRLTRKKETDFLGLNCRKTSGSSFAN